MSALLVVALLAAGPSAPPMLPLEGSPPSASAPLHAPSTVTRAGRIGAEFGVHLGVTLGAGLVGGLLGAGGSLLRGWSGWTFEFVGITFIGAAIGAGLAMLLSPLYLSPLHQRLSGRGHAKDAWLGLLAGLAVSTLTLPLSLMAGGWAPGTREAIYATSPLGLMAPIVGLEFGDLLASEAALSATVSVSTTGASVGVGGRW